MPELANDVAPSPTGGLRRHIKLLLGLLLLAALAYFSWRYGEIVRHISPLALATTTAISVVIIVLNGLISYRSLTLMAGRIRLLDALHVTAISAFANALGGLPVGLVYKFHVFRQQSGLSAKAIFVGFAYFTLLNVATLLALSGLLSDWWWLSLPLVACALLPALPFARWLPSAPGLGWRQHAGNLLLSLLTSVAMIICYLVLLTDRCATLSCHAEQAGMIGAGLALNFLINGQSLGGASEFTMGFVGFLHGARLLQGVELAIIIRLSSLLAALPLMGIMKIIHGQDRPL